MCRTGFGKALHGSISERVIGKTKCTVLPIKTQRGCRTQDATADP